MRENHETVQHPKRGRGNDKEVASRDLAGVVGQERLPAGRGIPTTPRHVPGDRRFSDFVAQVPQLGPDPRRAPQRVLAGHPSYQRANLGVNQRPSLAPRLPPPENPKPLPMPAADGFRLYDLQRRPPVVPETLDQHPEQTVYFGDPWPDSRPLVASQLLPQRGILDYQASPRNQCSSESPVERPCENHRKRDLVQVTEDRTAWQAACRLSPPGTRWPTCSDAKSIWIPHSRAAFVYRLYQAKAACTEMTDIL